MTLKPAEPKPRDEEVLSEFEVEIRVKKCFDSGKSDLEAAHEKYIKRNLGVE